MKLIALFDDFLRDEVNLNKTRVETLEKSVDAIEDFIDGSSWAPTIQEWRTQGSWAHKTIIKPTDGGEFDADLLVFVTEVTGWTPADYINTLYQAFRASTVYEQKVRRWSHCVTITYANESKIDIAPCIVNRGGYPGYEVCNRDAGLFERSEPIQYTDWLIAQNSYSGSNSFRKVTRIIKYLRDIKTTFTCPSVLLTTLLGNLISPADIDSDEFADTPTALKTMFGRLDAWLSLRPTKPRVANPFLLTEDFASSLDDDQYANLRTMIAKYRGWIDDAYDEADRNESIAKWQRVLGESFASGVAVEAAKSVSSTAIAKIRETMADAYRFGNDLVSLVKNLGASALPPGFNRLPHMHRPRWSVAAGTSFTVNVRATLWASREFGQIGSIQSLQALSSGRGLRFEAVNNVGIPFGSDYVIQWRVSNTDQQAYDRNALRGGFYRSDRPGVRWEELAYRGVHLVEAFLIRARDDTLCGQSEPFYVMIE